MNYWILILIGIAIVIVIAVVVYRRNRGGLKMDYGIDNSEFPKAGDLLTGDDKAHYDILAADLVKWMNCAQDGGDSDRCPPNWRDGGATRTVITPSMMQFYQDQLDSTEYSNDDIRKVVARNLIYNWRFQEKKKLSGKLVTVPVYEALFNDTNNGVL